MHLRKAWIAGSAALALALLLAGAPAALAGRPVGSSFVIGDLPVDTVTPAAARNSIRNEYLVVWSNDRPGNDDIYAQLVNPQGRLIAGWWVVAAGSGAERRHPDVAYSPNFNEFLVVWEQEDANTGALSVRGQRLLWTGKPTGGEILISASGPKTASRPRVAHSFTSGTYLVVWENHTQGNVSNDIVGQLVANDGNLLGGNQTIAQGTWSSSMGLPDLAYNRTLNEFLVVWQQLNKGSGLYDVYGRKVRGNGDLLYPASVEIAHYSVDSTAPAVAAIPRPVGQGRFLVAWELQYAPGNKNIMARVMRGDGSMPTGAFYVSWAPGDEFRPAVAGNEQVERFLVSWTGAAMSLYLSHARELTLDGELMPGDSILAEVFADHAAVADGPWGDFLVVFDGQTMVGNVDIHGRLWGNRAYLPLVTRE